MALTKSITLENGATGDYIAVGYHHLDPFARDASAHLMLFTSAAHRAAAPGAPLCLVAKLRLQGEKYDEYLSTATLAALAEPGADPVRGQIYAAAKVEPLLAGGGLSEVDLSDAEDV